MNWIGVRGKQGGGDGTVVTTLVTTVVTNLVTDTPPQVYHAETPGSLLIAFAWLALFLDLLSSARCRPSPFMPWLPK